jgi:hypothetical protein
MLMVQGADDPAAGVGVDSRAGPTCPARCPCESRVAPDRGTGTSPRRRAAAGGTQVVCREYGRGGKCVTNSRDGSRVPVFGFPFEPLSSVSWGMGHRHRQSDVVLFDRGDPDRLAAHQHAAAAQTTCGEVQLFKTGLVGTGVAVGAVVVGAALGRADSRRRVATPNRACKVLTCPEFGEGARPRREAAPRPAPLQTFRLSERVAWKQHRTTLADFR